MVRFHVTHCASTCQICLGCITVSAEHADKRFSFPQRMMLIVHCIEVAVWHFIAFGVNGRGSYYMPFLGVL